MATAAEKRQQEEARRRAAAAAAGVVAVSAAGDDQSQLAQVPPAAARAAAAGTILAALVAYLATQRARTRSWLREQLRRRAVSVAPEDIGKVIDEEERRGAEFERRSSERFARDITTALAIPDAAAREGAVRGIVSREERYARQRDEAMAARAFAAIDRVVLREQSPTGAFWKLDPTVVEHTAGCLIMGGKFWPWSVLDRVHPPRHNGCPCRLVGYGQAVADGLMRPGDVLDARTAIRRAAQVVMEGVLLIADQNDADALCEAGAEAEYEDLREALTRAELMTEEQFDLFMLEAFFSDDAHPRDPKGRWARKFALGRLAREAKAAWLWRDDETRWSLQRENKPGWPQAATNDEKKALHAYTGKGKAVALNRKLREGEPLSAAERKQVDNLDSAIKRAGLFPEPVTLWRGITVPPEALPRSEQMVAMTKQERVAVTDAAVAEWARKSFEVGDVYDPPPQFHSYSFGVDAPLDGSLAGDHAGILFETRTRSGAPVYGELTQHDDEDEVLLGRGSRFVVVGVLSRVSFERDSGTVLARTVVQLVEVED